MGLKMNKIYKAIIMIGLLNGIGHTIFAQYYYPTLGQWNNFESVASCFPKSFHEKISKKREIKASMERSPTKSAIKMGFMAAVNAYANMFSSLEMKQQMMEKDHIDGWSASPRLSQVDASSLLVKIIEVGDSESLAAFLEMIQNTGFNINKCFDWTVSDRELPSRVGYGYSSRMTRYSPLSYAVAKNQPGVVEMLIAHGARISQPLVNQALDQRNKELAEMLIVRAARLGQANIAVGAIPSVMDPVDGVIIPAQRSEVNNEYIEPSRLAQISQMRQQSQEAVVANRRSIQSRNSSGWYMIFLMLLFLPNLCLSFVGRAQLREVVCSVK